MDQMIISLSIRFFIALFWAVICFGSVIRIWSRSMEELKVSTDYTYNLSGDGYLDTGCNVTANHYNATMHVVKGFGAIPSEEIEGTSATGYCDHTWVNATITAVSLRFGSCGVGLAGGLWARALNYVAANAWWNYGASLLLPAPAAA